MTAALQQLYCFPMKYYIDYKLLIIVFQALYDRTPAHIALLITPYMQRHTLRSAVASGSPLQP